MFGALFVVASTIYFFLTFKIHPVELYKGFFSHSIALQMARAIAARFFPFSRDQLRVEQQ